MNLQCQRCDQPLTPTLTAINEHFDIHHPDLGDDAHIDTWPDGQPVIIDLDPQPQDYQ